MLGLHSSVHGTNALFVQLNTFSSPWRMSILVIFLSVCAIPNAIATNMTPFDVELHHQR